MKIINITEEDLNNNMDIFKNLTIKNNEEGLAKLYKFLEYKISGETEKMQNYFSKHNLLQQKLNLNYNYTFGKKYEIAFKDESIYEELIKTEENLKELSEKIQKENLDEDKKNFKKIQKFKKELEFDIEFCLIMSKHFYENVIINLFQFYDKLFYFINAKYQLGYLDVKLQEKVNYIFNNKEKITSNDIKNCIVKNNKDDIVDLFNEKYNTKISIGHLKNKAQVRNDIIHNFSPLFYEYKEKDKIKSPMNLEEIDVFIKDVIKEIEKLLDIINNQNI